MDRIIVMIGAPGAGKGTQARLLQSRLGIPHISTGDMFREMKDLDTPLAEQVRDTLASGKLVPDKLTFEMVKERTAREDCKGTYVLDGFPRTAVQAEMLESLSGAQGKPVAAIQIDVPVAILEKRLAGRRTCPVCGEIYNIESSPPKSDGVCDRHPETRLLQRVDDTKEKVRIRFETYEKNTKPLLEYYTRTGRLVKVDGNGEPESIYRELLGHLAQGNAAV